MELRFASMIPSFYSLMPRAYFLDRNDMEEKEITVEYRGEQYPVQITVSYTGLDANITAIASSSTLSFVPNAADGIDIQLTGEPMEEGLINEITWQVMKALE